VRELLLKLRVQTALCLACGLLVCCPCLALPAPDHIVIVVEENHSPENIIGSLNAPYITSLAATGANFTNFYALTHPSQPNYIQLYSGSNQGVLNNTVPAPGAPFTTANLGAELLAAGKTFGSYSEDLPAVGSTIGLSGAYARRHNPVVNWQSTNPGPNQYGPSLNMPFTSVPSNIGQLSTVSLSVPKNNNNMPFPRGRIIPFGPSLISNIRDARSRFRLINVSALSECGNPKVLAGLVLTLGKSFCIRWVRRSGIFGGYVPESTPVL